MDFLKKKAKGFTLIELLVVIAIIGILSSIVLVSVNSARTKAKDASVKSNIEGARVAAEMWYDDTAGGNMSYTNVCTSSSFTAIKTAVNLQGTGSTCQNSATAYCLKGNYSTAKWCADRTGYAGNTISVNGCTSAVLLCQAP